MNRWILAACIGLMTACATPVMAQSQRWQFDLGAAILSTPSYLGSDAQRTRVLPLLAARYGERYFFSPVEGIGIAWGRRGQTRISAALAPDFAQREFDSSAARSGLRTIGIAPALRITAEHGIGRVAVAMTVSSRLTRADRGGNSVRLEASLPVHADARWQLRAALQTRYVDRRYARNFIGINAQESVASGLPSYAVGSGWLDAGIALQARAQLSRRWSAVTRIELNRLAALAAESPLTRRRTQPGLIAFVAYRCD